jgi:hypothetical protein
LPHLVRRIKARISAGFIVRIWQADVPLGERRLGEAQHAPHLPDRVIEIVEHVTVIAGTAYAARRSKDDLKGSIDDS